jgi:hypothetical protein
MKLRHFFLILVFGLLVGCAHSVDFKTPDTYQYEFVVPTMAIFHIDKDLRDKMYSGRAWSSGIAQRWDVPVGNIVHQYAGPYLKSGFASFSEIDNLAATPDPDYDILIRLTDIDYYMEGQAAHCDLTFVIEDFTGKQIFTKKYHADGPSGFGRVFAAGAFAQKSAIRQSTHMVMENIYKNFLSDVQANYSSWK